QLRRASGSNREEHSGWPGRRMPGLSRRRGRAPPAEDGGPGAGAAEAGDLTRAGLTREEIRARVEALGPWFHNIDLNGVQTAPRHFLGDYPAVKWRAFDDALPADLTGRTVLDIGCNAGFYAIEMKRR